MLPIFEKAHQFPLTDTEKELLNYVENNLPASAFISLKDLGAKLYISSATVVRFCRKLGLKGYNEFKYQIRNELEQLNELSFSSNILLTHSLTLFKDNLENLDSETLETVARLLTSNRPLYICGSRLSSIAAKYLHTTLTALNHPSILIEWHHLLKGLVGKMSKDAILFIIAAHGDGEQYLPVFQKTDEQKLCTILLTCEPESPLIPYCTYILHTNDQKQEYQQTDVNSRLGFFILIQVLLELIAMDKTD